MILSSQEAFSNSQEGTMTLAKIEPNAIVVNFLRQNLTDINGSRSGNWIYGDPPRTRDLGDASYPRVGVIMLNDSAESLGIYENDKRHIVTMQIDCVTKKDLMLSLAVTNEAIGTVAASVNTDRLTYDYVPTSITSLNHDGTPYGTVNFVNTNSNFTTPGSLAADTIEVSRSTGDLNFNSTDAAGDVGEAITSTYARAMEGEDAVKYLARQIWLLIKNNWRTNSDLNGLFYPELISFNRVPLEEDFGIYRYTLEIQWNIYNVGEGL